MSLPQSIDPTVPHGLEALGKGAFRIREMKQFVVDVLGAPDATSVESAYFFGDADGVQRLFMMLTTTEPSSSGAVRAVGATNTNVISLYDGTQAQHVNGTVYWEGPQIPVGNVGGGEDVLMDFTFPAGYFHRTNAPNRAVEIIANGFFASNGNTKTLKIRVGPANPPLASWTLNPTTAAPNGTFWRYHGVLWATATAGLGQLMGYCVIDPGSTEASYHLIGGALDFDVSMADASTITVSFTGESGSAATDDIRMQNLLIRVVH